MKVLSQDPVSFTFLAVAGKWRPHFDEATNFGEATRTPLNKSRAASATE